MRETAPVSDPAQPHISDIVISHWHHDHVGGLKGVLSILCRLWDERKNDVPFTPPRLHKFPLPSNVAISGNQVPSILQSLAPGSFTPNSSSESLHDIRESQVIGPLTFFHSPGHTLDSLCAYLPEDQALFTADTVLGQGTAVFEDLAAYLSSLQKLLDFRPNYPYSVVYPGHGPVVSDGPGLIETYIQHRLEREAQIVATLKLTPPHSPDSDNSSEYWTTWTLVSIIYKSYPESLWLPAANSVTLHLKKLEGDGVVKRIGGSDIHTGWVLSRS